MKRFRERMVGVDVVVEKDEMVKDRWVAVKVPVGERRVWVFVGSRN